MEGNTSGSSAVVVRTTGGSSTVFCTVLSSSTPSTGMACLPTAAACAATTVLQPQQPRSTSSTSASVQSKRQKEMDLADKLMRLRGTFWKSVIEVVASVETDESFSIPTPNAAAVVSNASAMSKYFSSDINCELVKKFADDIFDMMTKCFSSKYKRVQFSREKMWTKYHQLRLSDAYNSLWCNFTSVTCGSPARPLFYQHVGHKLFKLLVEEYFSVHTTKGQFTVQPLSNRDCNIVRYIAGNVCYRIRDKFSKDTCTHPLKDKLLLAIKDLEKEKSLQSDQRSSDWVKAVDRGGLFKVTDDAYEFFKCMEEIVRKVFNQNNLININHETKAVLASMLLTDEEVTFLWYNLMEEVEEQEASALLNMIVELYMTIRGHWFATSRIEKYKQDNKESLQKSKSLRKTIESATKSKASTEQSSAKQSLKKAPQAPTLPNSCSSSLDEMHAMNISSAAQF